MKRPLKFLAFKDSSAVIVDSEKGNILDLRYIEFQNDFEIDFCSIYSLKSVFLTEISDSKAQ